MKESPIFSVPAADTKNLTDADISVASAEEIFVVPTSFAQQRLWFIDQFEPASPLYNVVAAVRLTGQLNIVALEQTLNEVIERHEVLRTTFAFIDGQPVQVIHLAMAVQLPVIDLSNLLESAREAEAQILVRREARRPFDLAQGPLLRVGLLRLGAEEHVVSLIMHHIVSDGWSRTVLIKEIAALYQAYSEGQASPLPQLPIQYADYAVWQREWLQGDVLDEQLDYWRRQLADVPPVLELPKDHPRHAGQRRRGAYEPLFLSAALSKKLKILSQQQGVTLFMTLLGAWQTLLFRYTNQHDIVIGADVANRNRHETEDLIGFFVNLLVLRTDLSGNPTFTELLHRVREVCLGAYAHQDLPFEKLVEELQPERQLTHTPLFDVMFVFQNVPQQSLALPGLKLSSLEVDTETAKFDLILSLQEGADSLSGTLSYNADLFEAATIRRLLTHYQQLLEGIVSNCDQRLLALPLLTAAERGQLLHEWNETAGSAYPQQSIQQRFEAQVAQTPEAIALVYEEQAVSYGELNERANQLAHYLGTLGVGAETLVGICVERSLKMVVGLLGILKAGGAYVPLDANNPLARLAWLIEDAGVQVLLTEEQLVDELPVSRAQVICLDGEWEQVAAHSRSNPEAVSDPENLAYVMYTSGSSGEPKGVAVRQGGVLRLVCGSDYVRFGGQEVYLQLAPLSFDASTFELWGALLHGARCVLYGERVPSGPQLEQVLREQGVSCMWLTAALFNQVVAEGAERLLGVGQVLVGGEALSVGHVRRAQAELPGTVFTNGYGPTETTTFACCYRIPELAGAEVASIPIGRAIGNTAVYVLDGRQGLAAVGVSGELYVGGAGLARGYLHEAGQTAAKFVPHPYSEAGGERLYRTGDVVRWQSGGELEFEGRRDRQVKLRGYRIELGEIEWALQQHAQVSEAVVVLREEQLVAYVVGVDERVVSSAELRQYLGARVPDYMVPAWMVQLEELPLTANGKLDRRALPRPELSGAAAADSYVAPRTPVEEVLAGIWQELLRVERVGVTDNFFELGGHSLLATQVISRLRSVLAVDVPLRSLFEQPTVAGLAQCVEAALRGGESVAMPPLLPVGREELLPLSFAQQRLWFIEQLEPESATYNVPASLRLSGRLDGVALQRTLSEVVRRHEVLRTTFVNYGGQPRQQIRAAAPVALPLIDLSALAKGALEAEVERLARAEAGRPFALSVGPLLRVQLLRLSEAEHVVLLTLHHIISDGWSLGILIKEVATLYSAYSTDSSSPLPELAIQYADYAVWQRGWLQGAVLEEQLQYWTGQLASAPPVLALPSDHARPLRTTQRGDREVCSVPAELMAALKRLGQAEGVTLYMVLLAAFQVLLYRYTQEEDLVVGAPIANRTQAETEGLIGFFVNTLVLRTDLSGNPTFSELLQRVREVCLGAYAHQELPFEMLIEALQPERVLGQQALAQVMFVMQNMPRGQLELPGLRVSGVGQTVETAKYDLLLTVVEGEGLQATFSYNADLFEAATIRRLLTHYQQLLEGIVSNCDQRLLALPLLTAAERGQLLYEWNETAGSAYPQQSIQQRFEAQVAQTPEAIALVYEEQAVSYGELNERANQLAHYLGTLGVRVETLVGICVERSLKMVVGLLGILKAGGAYVPLDANNPLARLAWLIEDAGVQVLLTEQGLGERLRTAPVPVVYLDTEWELIATQPGNNPAVTTAADNLAYVMYTSGSTGEPKGVAVRQSGVLRLVCGSDYVRFGGQEVYLQLAPLSFDASTFELWGALLHGARCVLYGERVPSGPQLEQVLREQGVSCMWLTAALFNQVVAEGAERLLGVGQVLVGGEALSVGHVRRAQAELPGTVFTNGYGPTETTTFACCYRIPELAGAEVASIPIGRAIGNTAVYVLDGRQGLAAVGVSGELYVGGAGLARGYLHEAGQTAAKFVPHPYSEAGGERLYRTGDVVRWQNSGELEFEGRRDRQVKLRGYRIELGEIEWALQQHAQVSEAVVVLREEQLVAYVVGVDERVVSSAELRQYLGARVPDYMVPAWMVQLEGLPLTANGKLDRLALPRPELSGAADSYVAPRTPVEEMLAGIWQELLRVERVGVTDNFFELGGHSLLATQVISRLRSVLAVDVSLRSLFEQPTVAGLAQCVETTLRGGESVPMPPLLPVGRDELLPLSFAQQRLWFIEQLEPESATYNVPASLRLSGRLDGVALQRTLSEVVRRHEVLRTTFVNYGGQPRQQIRAAAPVALPLIDLSALAGGALEAEVERLIMEESHRSFDLAQGPLLSVVLLRLGAEEHVASLTMHHIVSDGWSRMVLIDEIATLYQAYSEGQSSPLPELAIQYADYAVWQRGWLQGAVLEEQLQYWTGQLASAPPVLALPSDHARPLRTTQRGAREVCSVPAELMAALKRLSQAEGVTLYMVLLAAFQVLLYRYTQEEDLVVGTPIANRTQAETEGLIGFFINTLVLRTDLSGNPTFSELLQRVREVCLGAYAHQELPFEMLIEALQPERVLGQQALAQVMFVMQNMPRGQLELPGLRVSGVGQTVETVKYDLLLTVVEGAGLQATFSYNADLFEVATIRRLLTHYQQLLEGIVSNCDQRLLALPLLTAAERGQLLHEWNETAGSAYPQQSIQQRFEAQVAQTPEAIALVYEEQAVSYGELNERANQLAHYLGTLGVGAETLVGICVERSLEMVVGLLGILKAGGAYVPLDANNPLARLAWLIEDAGVQVLLTEEQLVDELPVSWAQVICLDGEWEQVAAHSRSNPEAVSDPENLAYVMYTSGSSGEPKGVAVRQGGVLRLVCGSDYVRFGGQEVYLQLAPLSFDASTFELWGALLHGARCVLYGERVPSGPQLEQVLREQGVSCMWLTAALFNQVVAEGAERLLGVGQVLVGGEALSVGHVRRAQAELPGTVFTNGYGPTETTTFACCYRIPELAGAEVASIPIGRAIGHTEVYVLDGRQGLAAVGVSGELYLGGAGLARGYLHEAGQTAAKFVPHPYSEAGGERLYRTGDVVRWQSGGELEFEGRRDRQVKLRGYRIELGEIEWALQQHAQVSEAVVVLREEQLVAYVVGVDERVVSSAELRQYLGARVPDYMVPAWMVQLEGLPLTANGKLDRRALPAPELSGAAAADSYVAPRTPVEELVAQVWRDVLRVERVGVTDNFFELGGHSLLATQVISRLRSVLAVDVSLRSLFEQPTVAGLTQCVETTLRGGESVPMPPLLPVGREELLPLSYVQQRIWFLDQLEPGRSTYNMIGSVRLTGWLHVAALAQAFLTIRRRHEALRTRFVAFNGQPQQIIDPFLPVSLPQVDLSDLAEGAREIELESLVNEEAERPFNLAEGPLLRIKLVRLSSCEYAVLLTVHHIISDGWSMGVLIKEVATLYNAYSTGLPSPLPELSLQFADYAVWQRDWLQGEVLDEHVRYWRERLAGAPPVLQLPMDRPRPAIQRFQGRTVSLLVDAETVSELRELSQREGASLFMVLLAAFQVLLHRYTQEDDLIIGTPIANRNRAESEQLIGFFINTLALRTDMSGEPGFRELVQRVREVALGAYAHQELPFEKLLEELNPERSLSYTPLFQVFFNMVNLPSRVVELPDLTMQALIPHEIGSNFDLTLYLGEHENGNLALNLVYNADLFQQSRMEEMLAQYQALLRQIIANPAEQITRFSLVTPASAKLLPDPSESLSANYEGSVQAIFAQQAKRVPERLAVRDKDETWSFQELDEWGNRLANHLRASGVESQDVVAIYGHRCATLVWALLGVLKAGAAFVILDPAYPAARLIDCLKVARPRGWLAIEAAGTPARELEEFVTGLSGCCRLILPQRDVAVERDLLAERTSADPCVPVGPDALAYIAFTSGSTGKPKGIAGRHGSLTHFLPWLKTTFGLQQSDRFSMLSGISHDPLHRDIFTPLQLGAMICVPDPDEIGDAGKMAAWMNREQITVAHLTPAMAQLLTETLDDTTDSVASLRYAFLVGDALTRRDVANLRKLAPSLTCVNYFGTTETQRAVGYYMIPPATNAHTLTDDRVKEVWPLGRGIEDVQLLVLNRHQQLAGVGESGEICVRSPHVALGYVDNEVLTRDRFIINPFTKAAGDWLYRTGDLGRYLPDGNVELIGRDDTQIKIRGFRVEPAEIEAVLAQHAAVHEVVVVVREDVPGDKRLVAYVRYEPEQPPDMGELLAGVRAKLPEYMVPSVIVLLESFPLTPNGKLDRGALPVPSAVRSSATPAYLAPRTVVEEVLAGIWSEVLQVDPVGVEDNFFQLGGHSLLATQVMARVRASFGTEVALRTLFERPRLGDLAQSVEAALRVGQGVTVPALMAGARAGAVPLSFAQQRLWFLHQLERESAAYNLPVAVRLSGPLDVGALREAVAEIVRRHESLRTAFTVVDDQPVQVVAAALRLAMPMVDLRALAPGSREAELRRVLQQEGQRSFDLQQLPLLRVLLLRLGQEEHVALLVMHHIISDGWSIGVLVGELAALYEAFVEGRPSPLAELPIQYADFAQWQRAWLDGDVLAGELEYWRRQLSGATSVLNLPTDRPHPPMQTFSGARYLFKLQSTAAAALKEMSRREGVTLFMSLLAAFQTLLYRYTGETDVLVGTPIANRGRTETERLIGLFINTLVLRTNVSGRQTFRQLLRQVREVALGAYAHQDIPFEKLVEELQPQRSLSLSPFFQVMFILQNAPMPQFKLPDLLLTTLNAGSETAKVDLTLLMEETAQGLIGCLEYNTDLFDEVTIRRLAAHLESLLDSAIADPDQSIACIPLLTETEQQQLVQWNHTEADYPRQICIHELFEAQVARTPDAIALVFEHQQLSYQELNQRANHLAFNLRSIGVGPGVLVGLCTERAPEMLIGVFGILKAGGAYVPLDPTYPSERLAFMVQDADLTLLLTQRHLVASLPEHAAKVICLDSEVIHEETADNPTNWTDAEALAYVIYTSGSTGSPKGVMIPHRAVANFLFAMLRQPGLTRCDILLAVTSLSFDIAALELCLPLIEGARLVLVSREVSADGVRLADSLTDYAATVMQATPATWTVLLDSGWRGLSSLKMLCGGEALSREQATRLLERGAALWNMYGPTETAIWSAIHRVVGATDSDHPDTSAIPLGRPIANTGIHLLDEERQLVPVGVPGELHIGGAGLAHGYLNRPDLSAEKFIPDGFSATAGQRLYQTGDMARYLPDGTIEFLGRIDHQVKLRGFRIELGEIEAVLAEHSAVHEVVVVVREDVPGDKRLVAYVRYEPEQPPDMGELLAGVRAKLPEYMVPSVIVLLESFPLTPNGKLDRGALPVPSAVRSSATQAYLAPRTVVEEVLAGIWSEVLQVDPVGVEDNFFQLGGHSLLATQVMARVQASFGTEVALRTLFERPRLGDLAQSVEAALRVGQGVTVPALMAGARAGAVPLSFAQQRLWFLHQLERESAAYNLPVAVRLSGPLDVGALREAVAEIVRRHESLRTAFTVVDDQPVQVVAAGLRLAVPMVDLRALAPGSREAELRRVLQQEGQRSFDLQQLPLLRVLLLRLGQEEHVALLVMHHIISDGWSMGLLMGELAALYEAFTCEQSSPLPPLPIQYPDYAIWQRQWLQSEALDTQLAYWKEKLGNSPAALELPADRARPPVQTFHGARHTFSLSASLTNKLKELSRNRQVTLYMTLLAGFNSLLHRYTHQSDIVVGTPIANRGDSKLEPLIGCFINTLCLRTELNGQLTFNQLLASVRETALTAYANQDVPFEKLVEELHLERDLSRTPLFQVMFTLQNAPQPTLESARLQLTPVEVANSTAKFDLELLMMDNGVSLVGMLEYNSDLFNEGTVARLASHFEALLTLVVDDPAQRLSDIPLLSVAEWQQCVEWNETATSYPLEQCLPQLFEAQVARTPDAMAAIWEDEQLTYRELNRRANRLAHVLIEQGVGPDVIVALLSYRNLDLLTAMVAVFKAGGAYLPLDPSNPPARLRQVLLQSRARLVLTSTEFGPTLTDALANLPGDEPQLLCFEDLHQQAHTDHDPARRYAPENLAYVIYTSGSTGVPKGAMIEHRGMLNHLFAKVTDLQLTQTDCLAQTASQCFDISVWQFLAALLVGGCVRIYDDEITHDAVRLLARVSADRVSIFETVPTLLQAALEAATRDSTALPDLSTLRWLVVTGEALPPELCRQWFSAYPKVPLLNAYGPTECSDDVTHGPVDGPPLGETIRMPIGRAVANLQLYVLDACLQPVPMGVSGELHVGGVGVGRGYLHDAARTAETFIPDQFAAAPGGRLYKTGDLTRRLDDGAIEFLGRVDHQVKIRGFRIELGEIEMVLLKHPAVAQVVVLARADERGQNRLAAYIVPHGSQAPTTIELRGYLKEHLPDYMIPQAFVSLPALPLTPNGKLDRRALPAPDPVRPETESNFVAPRTAFEQQLADIWQKTLRVERVGIHDNFFELGGDSILMLQVLSRASQAGIQLTLRETFLYQTIASLAARDATPRQIQAEQGAVEGEVPLTPAQHWLLEQDLVELHHFNQALLVEMQESMSPVLLRQVVEHLLVHHDALRLRLRRDATAWAQYIESPRGEAPFSLLDLAMLPEEAQREAIQQAAGTLQASLNLGHGPLWRVALFELGAGRPQRLLIIIHHLVTDGVSWRILLEDLGTAYRQLQQGEALLLPPKTTSFRYWAERLTEYARETRLQTEAIYWLSQSRQPRHKLPVDNLGANTVASARVITVSLSPAETHQLLQVVPAAAHAQINDLLLTALARSFARWMDSRRLLIDLEGHGREEISDEIDVTRTVGWFTAIFPVVLDLGATTDVGSALQSIGAQLRQIPGRGLSYGLLRYLGPDAEVAVSLRRSPQPEVIFNYLGQFESNDDTASTSGLRLASENPGLLQDPRQQRRYLLEVGGSVTGGQLHFTIKYSENIHRRYTIQQLADGLLQALRDLIEHYILSTRGLEEVAAENFPAIELSKETIDKALAELDLV